MVRINTIQKDVLLVNIYVPNRDDPYFYINRNENITKRKIRNLILAGDWNLVLDLTIDYQNYKRTNNVRAQKKEEEIVADHCLTDIRREHNGIHGDERTLFKKAGQIVSPHFRKRM